MAGADWLSDARIRLRENFRREKRKWGRPRNYSGSTGTVVGFFIKAHIYQIFIQKDHLTQLFFSSFNFRQDEKICENFIK